MMGWVVSTTIKRLALAALAAGALGGSTGCAQAQDNPLHALAKAAGFATDPPTPPDFVANSRPADFQPVPIFKKSDEPASKVMSKDDLKAMEADLDSASKKHDALRAAFPPAAKAMAEAEAAKRAKQKKKPVDASPKPAL